ncbi:MAG: 60S ribosomal protein L38 [Crenarchaeota archaeon]|nr:60S ribosomal protein L38 [Thermoproteota archaeon]
MPKEITDVSKIDDILKQTSEIRIKRREDSVKVKFRTKRYLYTIKLSPKEFEAIYPKLRELRIKIVEF